MFEWVKYLAITELTIETLFAQVFVMRHQMSCFRFLCFSSGLTSGLLKNPPPALLFHTYRPSAVPVEFHNYNDSVMESSREITVSYYVLKGHSASSQGGDHLGRVHSDQMFSR